MSLDAIVQGAGTVATGIPGLVRIHTTAPDSLNELPALVIHPDNGDLKWPRDPMERNWVHRLKMQVFVNRGGSLAEAEGQLRPFVDNFIETFDQHMTLNGTVSAAGITHYQYGVLTYAEVDYLGVTFDLTAEVLEPVVFRP